MILNIISDFSLALYLYTGVHLTTYKPALFRRGTITASGVKCAKDSHDWFKETNHFTPYIRIRTGALENVLAVHVPANNTGRLI